MYNYELDPNFSLRSFVIDYLGVDQSQYRKFLQAKKNTVDTLLTTFGKPLSETVISAPFVPLDYSKGGFEYMLDEDYGRYGGTQDAALRCRINGIVVYSFK